MSAHTPGPWHAHHDHGWLVVESDNGDLYIKIEKGSAATRRIADARLIAAAPELLDALRQWANAEATNDAEELQNARSSRDAANTKATGGQP